MSTRTQRGFSLIETLVSLVVLLLAMGGLASLLIQNARVNKAQQMTADVQSNARNCLSLIVQKLRSAGWDPLSTGTIQTVITDTDLSDSISEIEVFADFDSDGSTTGDDDEAVLIRHVGNRIEWRRNDTSGTPFIVLATNISNDEDGDGVIEPMFQPDVTPNPSRITVQITAQSPVPDPTSGQFIRYTVRSDVVLRKSL
jgi:prepilin-type N-terminal cleavage/methylation domain-containing protein